ncbi:MAG: DUF5716 family protein [Motiliproteus sp.]|nr:DUF5716 family protein [Motiliproteus sp.]MCW9054091.1 DUF5716 family protein [Motiliproteus sp.]
MLFNKLPDDLFLPLSGQNRYIYQAVLVDLADLFFDEDLIDPFIPKDLVRSTIEEAVIRHGFRTWAPELEGDEEGGEDEANEGESEIPRSTSEYASRIYRRLVKTGWLDEEQQLYRTYVLMAPSISYVLRTLVQVATFQKKSYGGAVLNVLSSVEAAIADPQGRGLTLQEAARSAAEFSAHLTDMLLGLRELKQNFAATSNAQEIVKGFFEQFVEAILVSDYKTLKTHNNPFRFRRQLLGMLRELQFDEHKLNLLIQHYQEVLELGNAEAEAKVHKHIGRIIRIFESVDQRLAAIDEFRFRLEKRVADTVRYMDKTTPGMSSRLSRLIAKLAEQDEDSIPRIDTFESYAFMSPKSVRSAPRKRTPPSLKIIQQQVIDPQVLMMRQYFKEYKERRQVTGAKVDAYIERHLNGNDKIRAGEFQIETIEDYICFSYVRHIASLGNKAKGVAGKYQLQFEDRYVNICDMVECRDFTLLKNTKKSVAKESQHAR